MKVTHDVLQLLGYLASDVCELMNCLVHDFILKPYKVKMVRHQSITYTLRNHDLYLNFCSSEQNAVLKQDQLFSSSM